jgi:hypothetical protein
LEVQVLWGRRSQRPRVNRKAKKPGAPGPAARPALKEAGSRNCEPTNRKHPSINGCGGYEAPEARVSGQWTAKLLRPKAWA